MRDRVPRGLVARDDQQQEVVAEVTVVQRLSIDRCLIDQARDDVFSVAAFASLGQ